MKKTIYLSLLSPLFLFSCSSDDAGEELSCTLSEFVVVNSANFDDETSNSTIALTITYDGEERIVTITSEYDEEYCTGSDCDTYTDIYTYTFTYNDNNEIATVVPSEVDEEDESIDIEYTDGNLSKIAYIVEYQSYTDISEYRFIYDNGKLTRVESWGAEEEDELIQYGYTAFTYSGNNITTEEYFSISDENGRVVHPSRKRGLFSRQKRNSGEQRVSEDVLSVQATMTYDDQPNPFYKNEALLLAGILDFAFIYSENNILTYIETDVDEGDEDYTTDITYTYNDEGFPISATVDETEGDEEPEPSSLTYSYTNCD